MCVYCVVHVPVCFGVCVCVCMCVHGLFSCHWWVSFNPKIIAGEGRGGEGRGGEGRGGEGRGGEGRGGGERGGNLLKVIIFCTSSSASKNLSEIEEPTDMKESKRVTLR